MIVRDKDDKPVSITRKVLFVEQGFNVNLFSVATDYDLHGTIIRFDPHNDMSLGDGSGTVIPFTRDNERQYLLPYKSPTTTAHDATVVESSDSNTSISNLWHRRMGHCSSKVLEHMPNCLVNVTLQPSGRADLIQITKNCLICPMAKLKSDPHPGNQVEKQKPRSVMHRNKEYNNFGDRVFMDLAGPLAPSIKGGFRYTSLFVDDGTDAVWVYFLAEKNEQKEQHLEFQADTAEYGDVKHYHSDNGGEFTDREYLRMITEEGAKRTFAVPYHPNNNNKAENTFWRLFCIARALLFESGLPAGHWPYALQHAAYILFRTPMKRIVDGEAKWSTPYQRLKQRLPHTKHLRVFGCQVSAEVPKIQRNKETEPKLTPRAEIAYYMGRSPNRKANIVFVPTPGVYSLTKGTYKERRTVFYHEYVTPRLIRSGLAKGFPLTLPAKQTNAPPADDDTDDEESAMAPAAAPQANAPDNCRTPGCTFRFGHDGAHSHELCGAAGRPSDSLRSRIPRPRALTAGVGDSDSGYFASYKEYNLESGAKLVWANNASSFNLHDAMFATNVLDAEDMADAMNRDDLEEICALVAKQKIFRNEGDGSFHIQTVPKNLKEVLKSDDKDKWVAAMWEELQSHLLNGTWILVPADQVPAKRRRVGSTWVFDIKRDANGQIIRWKARLCAQGFTQEEGVDYFNTYSNTIRYETLRLILALAAIHNLQLSSIDIKTAYLNGFIEDDLNIYMTPPRSFKFTPNQTCDAGKATFSDTFEYDQQHVCLLKRSIYGLKQSGRRWELRFWDRLKELGGEQSKIDPCLWVVRTNKQLLMIGIYVDDVVFASNSPELRNSFVKDLTKSFNVSDQGPLTWIFGTAIHQDLSAGTVRMDQRLYIEDLVHRYQPNAKKGRVIPCSPDIMDLVPGKEGELLHPQYRAIIGQLLWLSIISRPDISYAVSFLSRFCTTGTEVHFKWAVDVVGYLQVTKDKAITYHRDSPGFLLEHILAHSELKEFVFNQNTILTFTDASHGGERPMAGYVGFLADGPISWAAYRLSVTPLSVCQGEYQAATKAAVMTKAYSDCLAFIGFEPKGASPIFCDNRATILLSDSGISIKKLRHVATHIAFLRELVTSEDIMLLHISSKGQVADIFTKPLAAALFHELRTHLNSNRAK